MVFRRCVTFFRKHIHCSKRALSTFKYVFGQKKAFGEFKAIFGTMRLLPKETIVEISPILGESGF